MLRRRVAAPLRCVVPLMLFAACDGYGPYGPIPGGRLAGTPVTSEVEDWSFTEGYETYAVETRPSEPYSITTWGVASGGHFYVPTRDPQEKAWVQYVLSDAQVRLRVGDRIYERRAVHVTDPSEFQRVIPDLVAKYSLEEPGDDETGEVWLFRLDPR